MNGWMKNLVLGLKATGLAIVMVGGLSVGLAATTYTMEWANDTVFEAGRADASNPHCLVE